MQAALQQLSCSPQQKLQHYSQQQQLNRRSVMPWQTAGPALPRCRSCGAHLQQQRYPTPSTRRTLLCSAVALPFASIAASTAAGASAAAASTAPHWPAMLTSAGVLILCCAAAAVLLAGIPLLWSLTRTANRMESMLQTLEMELPDTAASIRLSSLELSDCMSELGALGSDVSAGVRSAAQIVTSVEAGAKQGAGLVGSVVVPALARRETRVRDVLEAALKARAELAPRIPQARAAVAATTATARKLRGGLMLTRVAAGMFDIGRAVRMQFTVAAAQQIVQQYEADRRAGSSEQPRRSKQQAQQPKEAKPAGRQPKPGPAAA